MTVTGRPRGTRTTHQWKPCRSGVYQLVALCGGWMADRADLREPTAHTKECAKCTKAAEKTHADGESVG